LYVNERSGVMAVIRELMIVLFPGFLPGDIWCCFTVLLFTVQYWFQSSLSRRDVKRHLSQRTGMGNSGGGEFLINCNFPETSSGAAKPFMG